MKKQFLQFFSFIILISLLQACNRERYNCQEEQSFIEQVPVYHSWEEIRVAIKSELPKKLEKPGKIYFYNNYIFINEQRKGIHIVDNNIPESPQFVSFIAIPGNMDMSIRSNVLYADNYTDLLAIDLSNLFSVQVLKRLENVFPAIAIDPVKGVLTHYEQTEIKRMVDCNSLVLEENELISPVRFDSGVDGIGGSFARFTLYGNYLYSVTNENINVFSIHQTDCPAKENIIQIGFGIETIFPHEGRLFIGSTTGMSIYGLDNPSTPNYISGYNHWRGCDPVFVYEDYAYVTIHSGNFCTGDINQLDVLNISDIYNPVLVESFAMEHPHGLAVQSDKLYLCEGAFGLKVFDVTNPLQLDNYLLTHLKDFAAYDVIALPGAANILLLIGEDGFFQFDISDPAYPVEISRIAVVK